MNPSDKQSVDEQVDEDMQDALDELDGMIQMAAVLHPTVTRHEPEPGTWADVARFMALTWPDDGTDWDAWKDSSKDQEMGLYLGSI